MGCGIKACFEEEQEKEHKREIAKLKKKPIVELLCDLKEIRRELRELVNDQNLQMTRRNRSCLDGAHKVIERVLK
jgi:hypothetical protein